MFFSRKRFPVVAAVIVLVFLLFTCSAAAESQSGTIGGLSWTLDDAGTLAVSGSGRMDWLALISDTSAWNPYKDRIVSVRIQSGITNIADYAFSNCRNLRSVEIPASVETIGRSAFEDCVNLREVVIPEGVTKIGIKTFSGCLGMTVITVPASVTVINEAAFADCGGFDHYYDCHTPEEKAVYWGSRDFHLNVVPGSFAEKYARESELSFHNGKKLALGWKARLLDIVDEIFSRYIKPGMTDLEKAKAFYSWMVRHVRYGNCNHNVPVEAQSLVYGRSYCDGYTFGYSLLLKKAGISDCQLNGTINGSDIGHLWNLVNIDNQWYHVDTTFGAGGNKSYFMLTDQQMRSTHTWPEEISADNNRVPADSE